MDAMTLLEERRSMGKLTGPAPTREQLDTMYRAALRAPDHKELTPWRFIEITGDGLSRLGDLFAEAESRKSPGIDAQTLDTARKKPLRAPLIIAVIAKVAPDVENVPKQEQVLSAGCAAYAISLAAYAQGLGAMWRTGHYAFDPTVKEGLGVSEQDEIVGFLYIGQLGGRHKLLTERDPEEYVERWT